MHNWRAVIFTVLHCFFYVVTGDSAGEGSRDALSQTGSSFSQGRLKDCSNGTEISLNLLPLEGVRRSWSQVFDKSPL